MFLRGCEDGIEWRLTPVADGGWHSGPSAALSSAELAPVVHGDCPVA
jgi:hypothetical protein